MRFSVLIQHWITGLIAYVRCDINMIEVDFIYLNPANLNFNQNCFFLTPDLFMDCTRICFIEKNFKFDYLAAKHTGIF